MPEFRYRALRLVQTPTGNPLVLFAAPATEVDCWAGIPQKKVLAKDGAETIGFQREDNNERLESLKSFYQEPANVLQNPLLCATRVSATAAVEFRSDSPPDASDPLQSGELVITTEELEDLPLLELLRRARKELEKRVPALASSSGDVDRRVVELKQKVTVSVGSSGSADDGGATLDSSEESETAEPEDSATQMAFSEESHIYDFWLEVAARERVLSEISTASDYVDEFEGFTKDALISYLRPIVLVDGQHRLLGAVRAARATLHEEPYLTRIEQAVVSGADQRETTRRFETEVSRKLPMSLLLTDDPAEHVFQFVVVNQKATPVGRALLGTIVSTSLSVEELTRVSERLERAGIRLQESRLISFFARNPRSPFFKLIERGVSDDSNLLPWTVMGSLIRIFRELKGGKLYHEKNDYADKWRRTYLPDSQIVAGSVDEEHTAWQVWSAPEGPWRDVFMAFWSKVRDELADSKDAEAQNHWGSSRKSQIFNQPSLTILAADFFQFMCDRQLKITNVDDIPGFVADWLTEVNPTYFSRVWNLSGVKKDSPGIKKRWAKLWVEYRKDPQQLPQTKLFASPLRD